MSRDTKKICLSDGIWTIYRHILLLLALTNIIHVAFHFKRTIDQN